MYANMNKDSIIQLKKMIQQMLENNPNLTVEEISQHLIKNGYSIIDKDMFVEWLDKNFTNIKSNNVIGSSGIAESGTSKWWPNLTRYGSSAASDLRSHVVKYGHDSVMLINETRDTRCPGLYQAKITQMPTMVGYGNTPLKATQSLINNIKNEIMNIECAALQQFGGQEGEIPKLPSPKAPVKRYVPQDRIDEDFK